MVIAVVENLLTLKEKRRDLFSSTRSLSIDTLFNIDLSRKELDTHTDTERVERKPSDSKQGLRAELTFTASMRPCERTDRVLGFDLDESSSCRNKQDDTGRKREREEDRERERHRQMNTINR